MMENILQNLLLITMGLGSFFVLTSRNHVHSVMFLILVFISAAGILLFLGAEFIALIFIIIYVGAIAVLFLFIVMMLDIKINRTQNNILQYVRSEEHTSELQSRPHLVCRLLLEKKKKSINC